MHIILGPLLDVVSLLLGLYVQVVFISVIMSWLAAYNVINTRNQFVSMIYNFLYSITEPAYKRIRRVIPPMGTLDLSPIFLLVALYFVQGVVRQLSFSMMPV
ncbi:MAG: YggT family protein [Alphaproteobacteria bacterium]|nr:YggT family protein [Alphaproteobacteria bacterium]